MLFFPVFFHYFSAELPANMNSYISEDTLKEKLRLTSEIKQQLVLKLLFYCVQSKEQTVYNIHSLLQTTPSIKDNHKPQDVPVGGAYHAHLETFSPDTKTFF